MTSDYAWHILLMHSKRPKSCPIAVNGLQNETFSWILSVFSEGLKCDKQPFHATVPLSPVPNCCQEALPSAL
jgi:hypothetical protein